MTGLISTFSSSNQFRTDERSPYQMNWLFFHFFYLTYWCILTLLLIILYKQNSAIFKKKYVIINNKRVMVFFLQCRYPHTRMNHRTKYFFFLIKNFFCTQCSVCYRWTFLKKSFNNGMVCLIDHGFGVHCPFANRDSLYNYTCTYVNEFYIPYGYNCHV